MTEIVSPRSATTTGGRQASLRLIAARKALAVGQPDLVPPPSWRWLALSDLARLESGHTPSRRHAEYWRGTIPWLSIQDAKANHGGVVDDTTEHITDLGLANSSARVLPAATVCLSRTASVGYVVITSRSMATSQDFVNWVCGEHLTPAFLKYIFLAEGDDLLRFASGAVHQTIYFPEAKAFHVCVPNRIEQQRIVAILDKAFLAITHAKADAERNLLNARELAEQLTASVFNPVSAPWPERPLEQVADIVNGYAFKSTDFHAVTGVKSIKITNVGVRQFVADHSNYLPAPFAQSYSGVAASAGSIVLALTRTIIANGLKVAVVPDEYDGALVNQRVAAITPRGQDLLTPFLFAYLTTSRVSGYVRERVNTLMQPNLSIADLRALPIPVPPIAQQRNLAEKLARTNDEFDALLGLYRRKLTALDELKKSLLHQAFSGGL